MKKNLFLLSVVFTISFLFVNPAFCNEYTVDDEAVETALESAHDDISLLDNQFYNALIPSESCEKMGSANAWIAFALATVVYYIPGILQLPFIVAGMHRIYLGTKTLTWVGYILTGGGCAIVQLVDSVLLLIGALKNDISKYEDNPKFFMW